MSEWRDMATAPKDGTMVLLALSKPMKSELGYSPLTSGTRIVLGWWDDDYDERGWETCCYEAGTGDSEGHYSYFPLIAKPTHWMPLPEPP